MDRLERVAQLREHIEADPTDADALFEIACLLRELEDYAAASPYAERACELRPRFRDAVRLVALCRHLGGAVEAAWPWYERALALGETDPVVLYNAGVAADALLRYEDAARLYRQALAQRPDYPEALNNLGIALAQLGRYADAERVYLTLLELRHPPARHTAHCNLGLVYLYEGRPAEAIESLRAAISLEPRFAVAWCNLGNAYFAAGDLEQADKCYRECIAIDPDNVLAYNALGALREGGEATAGRVEAEYAAYLDRYPWSALVYYNLALALAERGKVRDALEQLGKALALEPRFQEAQTAKRAYERLLRSDAGA